MWKYAHILKRSRNQPYFLLLHKNWSARCSLFFIYYFTAYLYSQRKHSVDYWWIVGIGDATRSTHFIVPLTHLLLYFLQIISFNNCTTQAKISTRGFKPQNFCQIKEISQFRNCSRLTPPASLRERSWPNMLNLEV